MTAWEQTPLPATILRDTIRFGPAKITRGEVEILLRDRAAAADARDLLDERVRAIAQLIEPLTSWPDGDSVIASAIQAIVTGTETPADAIGDLGGEWDNVLANFIDTETEN